MPPCTWIAVSQTVRAARAQYDLRDPGGAPAPRPGRQLVHRPRGVPQDADRTLDQGEAFGQQVGDRLVRADGPAVLLTDLRVLARRARARRGRAHQVRGGGDQARAPASARRPSGRSSPTGSGGAEQLGAGVGSGPRHRPPSTDVGGQNRGAAHTSARRTPRRVDRAMRPTATVAGAASAPDCRPRSSASTGPRNGASTSPRPNSSATMATSTPGRAVGAQRPPAGRRPPPSPAARSDARRRGPATEPGPRSSASLAAASRNCCCSLVRRTSISAPSARRRSTLPEGRRGISGDEHDPARPACRSPAASPTRAIELVRRRPGARRRADRGHDRLAVARVGHAEHRAVDHGRVTVQHGLHLGGRDLEPAHLDHLLGPVGDVHPAVGVEPADVPGPVPAVDEGTRRSPRPAGSRPSATARAWISPISPGRDGSPSPGRPPAAPRRHRQPDGVQPRRRIAAGCRRSPAARWPRTRAASGRRCARSPSRRRSRSPAWRPT